MEPFHFNPILAFLAFSFFLQFFLVNFNALGHCLQEESSALLQLKQDFNSSDQLDTWRSSTDCCIWTGVRCDESSRVTDLDLSNRKINGKIGPSLFNLTSLRNLNFAYNYFEGEIPISISQLIFLKVLNLSHNYLIGEIPPQLGNLSQLESLDLSINNLTGKIPQNLVALTSLSWLNLSYNKLVGQIPTGGQFSTFPSTSFEGNEGLCRFSCNTSISVVNNTMSSPSSLGATTPKNKSYMIVLGILFVVGFGI